MKHKIHTVDEYDFSDITIKKPVKTEDNLYFSEMQVYVQTPIIKFSKKTNNSIVLTIDDKMQSMLDNFDNKIVDEICKNSKDFFDDDLTIDDLDEMYKNSFKKDKLVTKFNDNLEIYNSKKIDCTLDDLKENSNLIAIINCSKILYYKSYCIPYWEISQIKIKKEKKEKKEKVLSKNDKNENKKCNGDNGKDGKDGNSCKNGNSGNDGNSANDSNDRNDSNDGNKECNSEKKKKKKKDDTELKLDRSSYLFQEDKVDDLNDKPKIKTFNF